MFRAAKASAEQSGNKNLLFAVQHLSHFIFGDPNIPEDRQVDPNLMREKMQLEHEKRQLAEGRVGEFQSAVNYQIKADAAGAILEGLDPNNALPELVRNTIVEKVMFETARQLENDAALQRQMKTLWQQATPRGISRELAQKIHSVYLAKFNAVMPAIRSKIRSDAMPKKAVQRNRSVPSSGAVPRREGDKVNPKDVDWSKTSTEDFLNGKVSARVKR